MRWATVVLLAFAILTNGLAACTDVRGYEGTWTGKRVGNAAPLRVGGESDATATLAIDTVDTHGIHGHLTVSGLVDTAEVASIEGAEADALSGITFNGSPQRVYLAFVDTTDGGGQAFAVIALYDEKRIEVRLLRGGTSAVYGIFALAQS